MLTGTVLYYRRDGRRIPEMCSDVTAAYALRASRGSDDIVVWTCTNGDPRDVRYYSSGRLLSDAEVSAWEAQ